MPEVVVSVVTPALNAARHIEECVDSIRRQSFANWEHLIVDDGSIDATYAIVVAKAASDPRVRIERASHEGSAAARNRALKHAQGRYIAFLDADDIALPGRLERQVEFLDANSAVDVMGGGIVHVSEGGFRLGIESLPADHASLAAQIHRRCPFFMSTVMGRRQFFERFHGFDPRMRRAQDYDLWLRGYRTACYHNLQFPLSAYRHGSAAGRTIKSSCYSSCAIVRAMCRERQPVYRWMLALRPIVGWFVLELRGRRL